MKKFYFSLVAAMMLTASTAVAQDGKTCETALPYPGMLVGAQVTGETWYTVTVNELSMFPSSEVTTDVAEITIYEGCDGGEAIQKDVNCYFLYPNTEYKMKIVPKENIAGMFIMGAMSLAGAPAGIYCVKPIVWPSDEYGYGPVKQQHGTTKWYQRDFVYNGKLKFTKDGMNPVNGKITEVEVKREDCKAVSNIAEGLNLGEIYIDPAPYVKAGTALIAITLAKSDDPDAPEAQLYITQPDAVSEPNCNNRPERMPEITLNTETAIANGYIVKDFSFKPTASGTYTFECTAAEGTVFNVGTIVATGEKRNPGTEYESDVYECRYDNDPVIVNSTNKASIVLALEAGKTYVVHYDSDYELEGGTPSVKVVEGGTSINSIEANKKTDVTVSENPTDGNFTVSSYLLPDCGEIALYDMGANKVFGTKSLGGKEQNIQLTNVKSGVYLLVVYGRGRSACTKLIVK